MKTSISLEGQLLIVAENATEAYTLRQWWEKFDRSAADACPVPGATSSISVDYESYADVAKEKQAGAKPAMVTWFGKDIRTLDKEELIDVILFLRHGYQETFSPQRSMIPPGGIKEEVTCEFHLKPGDRCRFLDGPLMLYKEGDSQNRVFVYWCKSGEIKSLFLRADEARFVEKVVE